MRCVDGKAKNTKLEDDGSELGYAKDKTSVTTKRRMTRSSNGIKTKGADAKCNDARPKRERK